MDRVKSESGPNLLKSLPKTKPILFGDKTIHSPSVTTPPLTSPSVAAAEDDRRRFEWRHTIRLRLSDLDCLIEIDLLCEGTLRDRLVGRVRVAVRDLTEEGFVGGAATHVSYQVRTAGGKPNGVLNFSYDLILPPPQMVWPPPTAAAAEKPGWWYRPPPQEVWST
ncbi:hypothetical protein QJS10_CPA16g00925 [Acorus calamus]|uniref:Uncharacterized protein n=1 Tax=Acorus calamus TaxID=4465 RepID=A0AAV9D2P9_ACOCL|nr:hypothetical protein QJS10_CPA16g00925 [Acorus calamus]